LAQAMEFDKAEVVEWVIIDKHTLTLKRIEANSIVDLDKKKLTDSG
jgi:hypothetical protein